MNNIFPLIFSWNPFVFEPGHLQEIGRAHHARRGGDGPYPEFGEVSTKIGVLENHKNFLFFFRCKRCNFAMEMEVDKTINKVFQCLQCDAKFCRICEVSYFGEIIIGNNLVQQFLKNDWDDDHFGIAARRWSEKRSGAKRTEICEFFNLFLFYKIHFYFSREKQLNEAVLRKCSRCGLVFMKDQGCNKMTCRCGKFWGKMGAIKLFWE